MGIDSINPVQLEFLPRLIDAVKNGDVIDAQRMLQLDPRLALVHYEGETAMMTATRLRQTACLLILLRHSDTDAVDEARGQTALHIACGAGFSNGVKILAAESDLRQQDHEGRTPLMVAASRAFDQGVAILAPASDLGQTDNQGLNALGLAKPCATNNFDFARCERIEMILQEHAARHERKALQAAIQSSIPAASEPPASRKPRAL